MKSATAIKLSRTGIKAVTVGSAATALLFAAALVFQTNGVRINVSGSLPGTIYKTVKEPARGDYITFCPPVVIPTLPDAGRSSVACDGKLPLIKRVVGMPGDRVVVTEKGVMINGFMLSDSRPKSHTRHGYPLPQATGTHILKEGEYWVAGDHEDSYDSRYFGSINKKSLL